MLKSLHLCCQSVSGVRIRRRNYLVGVYLPSQSFSRSCQSWRSISWQCKPDWLLTTNWLIDGTMITRCMWVPGLYIVNNPCIWTMDFWFPGLICFVGICSKTWSGALSCLSFVVVNWIELFWDCGKTRLIELWDCRTIFHMYTLTHCTPVLLFAWIIQLLKTELNCVEFVFCSACFWWYVFNMLLCAICFLYGLMELFSFYVIIIICQTTLFCLKTVRS